MAIKRFLVVHSRPAKAMPVKIKAGLGAGRHVIVQVGRAV
jgi:hypothetical protein